MNCISCGNGKMARRSVGSGNPIFPIIWAFLVLSTAVVSYLNDMPLIGVGFVVIVAIYILSPQSHIWRCKTCSATVPRPAGFQNGLYLIVLIATFLWVPAVYYKHFTNRAQEAAKQQEEQEQRDKILAEQLPKSLEKFRKAKEEFGKHPLDRAPPGREPEPVAVVTDNTPLTEVQDWTDNQGRTLQAALISVTGGKGLFRRPNGDTFEFEIKQLSAEDIDLIDFALEQRKNQ